MSSVSWVALDPGHKTGLIEVAQIVDVWDLREMMTLDNPERVLAALHKIKPSAIVMEAIPVLGPDPQVAYLFHGVRSLWRRKAGIWIVYPGQWKPVVKRLGWQPHPQASDEHQRDVYNMFRWFIWSRLSTDIGELKWRKSRRRF